MKFISNNVIITFIFTLVLSGCTPSPEKAYENLQKSKSVEQFDAFIKTYPESDLLSKVKKEKEQFEYESVLKSQDLELVNAFVSKYPKNPGIAEALKLKEELSYKYIIQTNDLSAMKDFLSEFPDSKNVNAVELRLLKKEAIGRRVRSYRTVSFVVDSVNVFMGFGIERKAEYVVAIEGDVVEVTENKKLKFTIDKVYVTNSSNNTYGKGQVGDLRYRPTAQAMAQDFLNSSQFVSASKAKYIE